MTESCNLTGIVIQISREYKPEFKGYSRVVNAQRNVGLMRVGASVEARHAKRAASA